MVFKIEKLKYRFEHRFMPNSQIKYEKRLKREYEKKKIKCKTDKEREELRALFLTRLANSRKGWENSQNQNYHVMDFEQDFSIYLNWNKDIHKKEMVKNIIGIGLCVPFLFTSLDILVLISIICNLTSLGINFECVNLQNYNLIRYGKIKDKMLNHNKKKRDDIISKYNLGIKTLDKAMKMEIDDDKKPRDAIHDIIETSDTESLENLKNYLTQVINQKNMQDKDSKNKTRRM